MPAVVDTLAGESRSIRHRSTVEAVRSIRVELGPILAGSVLPFVLVLYLALQGGGYDAVIRSEVGVAVWWVLLLGALVGILPVGRVTAAAWAALGLLAAFAAWTALGISWSESSERSVAELARVATYLGVLALAIAAQGRDGLRRTVYSVGTALAVIGALALLSRLHPSWFPANETGEALEFGRSRLNYPVDYWNGLATLLAIGLPLLLAIAVEGRRIATQALATAAVPVMALAAFYTLSRGGAAEMVLVLVAFLVLYPRRLVALPSLLLGTGGGALLILAATQRDALENGPLSTQAALDQGDEMLAMTIVVCAGIALTRAALGLAVRHGVGPRLRVSRRATTAALAGVAVVAVVGFLAAGGPGELSERWEEFKRPIGAEGGGSERFESASGNGRYQWWQAALDANAADPLIGIGPGTFEYFWAENGSIPGFIRDAHSLFLGTLAELGVIGLILIAGLVFGVIGFGAWRSFAAEPSARPWFAVATAACVGFAAAAAIDSAWEMGVIPIIFMLLAASLLSHRADRDREERARAAAPRVAFCAVALAALVAIAIPLAGTNSVRASQEAAGASRFGPALESAREASEIQPWAATPHLQQALVLELGGDLDAAASAARAATTDEPTNWRTWLVLSRIEAYRGRAGAAVAAYREARSLNPRSPLFAR